MYWVTVEGRPLPKLVGGHPALDLCNTYAGWGGPPLPRPEWLPDADTLIVWCMHAGVLEPDLAAELRELAQVRPAKAKRTLDCIRQLRTDLHATLINGDQAAFDRVADLAQRAAGQARLVGEPDRRARWVLPAELNLDLPLLRLASVAAELLVSDERALVRACPGDECGWLFLDRRGRRRWCSMQTCGNRAKVNAFASRRRRDA